MMKNCNYFTLLLFLLVVSSSGCGDKCGDDTIDRPNDVYDTSIQFDFIDKSTGRRLLQSEGAKFIKNDIKLFTDDGKPLRIDFEPELVENMPQIEYYIINILFSQPELLINDDVGTNRLFIDLKDDRDTIDVAYKVVKDKCALRQFESLRINYNGIEVAETNRTSALIKIYK